MRKPRTLKVMGPSDAKLGRATIMDRALAQRYGAAYVHLAAFAIDVDRVRERDERDLPFAWEVYLTEAYLRHLVETAKHDPTPMIEDTCLAILELPRPRHGEAGALGSQLPFAIYTAVGRDILPASVGQCFASWAKPPADLIDEMASLDQQEGLLARLVDHCLRVEIDPPLVGPVREALLGLRGGEPG